MSKIVDSIEHIKEAFRRVWREATNQKIDGCFNTPLMTIPPDEKNDADCIIFRAINELQDLRSENEKLEAEIEKAREEGFRDGWTRCQKNYIEIDSKEFKGMSAHNCMLRDLEDYLREERERKEDGKS